MPGPARLKGDSLHMTIGTTELFIQASACVLDNEAADASVTTFEDAAAGGSRQYFFQITALQSLAATSLWRYLWENTGEIAEYEFAPAGNAVPSTEQPHFVGTLKVGPKPKIGGEAGATVTHTFDYRLDCQEEPVLVTAP